MQEASDFSIKRKRLIEVHQRPAATHEAIPPDVEASCDTRSHIL
jgi:hypothetical protein